MSASFDHIALRKAVTRELRRQRRVAGLSQSQMAIYLDTHRPIISRMERLSSPHTPSLDAVARWAAVTGHSLLDVARAIDAAMGATPPYQPYGDRGEHGDRSSSCRSNRRSPSTASKAARARAAR